MNPALLILRGVPHPDWRPYEISRTSQDPSVSKQAILTLLESCLLWAAYSTASWNYRRHRWLWLVCRGDTKAQAGPTWKGEVVTLQLRDDSEQSVSLG
jgi:hypothetical protein